MGLGFIVPEFAAPVQAKLQEHSVEISESSWQICALHVLF